MHGRKILAGLFCILLSLFLVGYIAILMFNTIVDEELIKDVLKQKMKSEINENVIEQLKLACELGAVSEIPIPVGTNNISLSCTEIETTTSEITDLISEKVAKIFFYRNISCEILECLKNGEIDALFSYKAKVFFQKFETPLLVLSVICALLVFAVLRSFSSGAKSVGTTLLLTIIPLFVLDFFTGNYLSEKLPQDSLFVRDIILEKLSLLHNLYFSILALGIALLISGIIYQKLKKVS